MPVLKGGGDARELLEGRQKPRLEIGSGYAPTDGFIHLDLNENAPDLDWCGPAFPLPWPDESFYEIRAVDVLEHIGYRHTIEALAEWARVLRVGGELYVQVPDAEAAMRMFFKNAGLLVTAEFPDPLDALQWRLMGGQEDGDHVRDEDDWRLNAHYSLFSRGTLTRKLDTAGFTVVQMQTNNFPNLMCWARKDNR
jgi:hypothetical protein